MQNFVNNLERPNTLKQRAILALRNQRRNKIGDLITLKLTSYLDRPFDRAVDRGDVVELIKWHRLPRNLPVDEAVSVEYMWLWDGLRRERGEAV